MADESYAGAEKYIAGRVKNWSQKALPEDALYSWQEVKHYFQLAEPLVDNLWQAMTQLSVEEQWRLTLHILKRLNDVVAQIDDSGGFRFEIEGQIYLNMAELFEQLSWSTEGKQSGCLTIWISENTTFSLMCWSILKFTVK